MTGYNYRYGKGVGGFYIVVYSAVRCISWVLELVIRGIKTFNPSSLECTVSEELQTFISVYILSDVVADGYDRRTAPDHGGAHY